MKHKAIPGERLATSPGCPSCGTMIDGYTSAGRDRATPKRGDVSTCWYCGEILVFDGRPLSLRKPTAEDMAEIEQMQDFMRLHRNLLLDIAARKPRQ